MDSSAFRGIGLLIVMALCLVVFCVLIAIASLIFSLGKWIAVLLLLAVVVSYAIGYIHEFGIGGNS